MRSVDRRTRAAQFPLKVAAFRHSFALALDADDYHMELPWSDLLTVESWQERARRARAAMANF